VQANDRDERVRELFGKMNPVYRLCAKKIHVDRTLFLTILSDKPVDELKELVEDFNQ
jgi:hypothetical protein